MTSPIGTGPDSFSPRLPEGEENAQDPRYQEMTEQRRDMVERQIRARGVRDPRVLEAMLDVPRHLFVPIDRLAQTYRDQPIAIGAKQTISQPFMVAAMTEALELKGDERILEIGTGSGYQAAVLARLAKEIFTVEVDDALAESARQRLGLLGFLNVVVVAADGSAGLAEHAPYDGIIVTAAAPAIPPPLIEQLAENGRLVIPVASPVEADTQELIRVRKQGDACTQEILQYCRFVPLLGRYGWREKDC
jgi:protein-L-isoaspartate(D-aspartate) O-methyltransferase